MAKAGKTFRVKKNDQGVMRGDLFAVVPIVSPAATVSIQVLEYDGGSMGIAIPRNSIPNLIGAALLIAKADSGMLPPPMPSGATQVNPLTVVDNVQILTDPTVAGAPESHAVVRITVGTASFDLAISEPLLKEALETMQSYLARKRSVQ